METNSPLGKTMGNNKPNVILTAHKIRKRIGRTPSLSS
jgi:hypothetical protein